MATAARAGTTRPLPDTREAVGFEGAGLASLSAGTVWLDCVDTVDEEKGIVMKVPPALALDIEIEIDVGIDVEADIGTDAETDAGTDVDTDIEMAVVSVSALPLSDIPCVVDVANVGVAVVDSTEKGFVVTVKSPEGYVSEYVPMSVVVDAALTVVVEGPLPRAVSVAPSVADGEP